MNNLRCTVSHQYIKNLLIQFQISQILRIFCNFILEKDSARTKMSVLYRTETRKRITDVVRCLFDISMLFSLTYVTFPLFCVYGLPSDFFGTIPSIWYFSAIISRNSKNCKRDKVFINIACQILVIHIIFQRSLRCGGERRKKTK